MIKEKAFLLADKLEGRGYRQGRDALKIGPRRFCCLGVACQVAGLKAELTDGYEWEYEGKNMTSLPTRAAIFFDFYDGDGGRRDGKKIVIDGCGYRNLASANDSNVSFKKIAKYIRENYKQL